MSNSKMWFRGAIESNTIVEGDPMGHVILRLKTFNSPEQIDEIIRLHNESIKSNEPSLAEKVKKINAEIEIAQQKLDDLGTRKNHLLRLSKGDWVFERSSGYAGYYCRNCGMDSWIYERQDKICKCDE